MDFPSPFPLQRKPFASGFTSGLPGSLTVLSTRALPNHPGQPDRFVCPFIPYQWQASPSPEGWPLPISCNEAESGLIYWAHVFAVQRVSLPFAPRLISSEPVYSPFLVAHHGRLRLHVERTIYMSDTFQSDRTVRLCLANRRERRRGKKIYSSVPLRVLP